MDIWGTFWVLLSLLIFFFGYGPMFLLLVFSSLFQGSVALKFGDSGLPLFYFVECVAILRFVIPQRKSRWIINFNNMLLLRAFFLLILFWTSSFLVANLFSGARVYSPQLPFELNYFLGGVPLTWGFSNINQLILLSLNIIMLFCVFERRMELSNEIVMKGLFGIILIFSVYSFLWVFVRPAADLIQGVIYNSGGHANAIFEMGRLSGTFGEPSFAGVFLGSLAVPIFLVPKKTYKILSIILLFFLIKNNSSSGYFSFLISLIFVFIFYGRRDIFIKTFMVIFLLFITCITYFVFSDWILDYASQKSISDSGITRQASNISGIENLIDTYGFGVGVGSTRISSLIICIFANFGIVGAILLIAHVFSIIKRSTTQLSPHKLLFLGIALISFVGSFAANPDYSFAILWVFLYFAVIADCKQPDNDFVKKIIVSKYFD
ncbi:hypothetical protein AAFL31_29025 [Klebsiella huaxiensis]|uniref:hypothetical protein n=1 Tax=Klebsiella huaxiensis TaxID=2153354 RepID=UPI00316497BF